MTYNSSITLPKTINSIVPFADSVSSATSATSATTATSVDSVASTTTATSVDSVASTTTATTTSTTKVEMIEMIERINSASIRNQLSNKFNGLNYMVNSINDASYAVLFQIVNSLDFMNKLTNTDILPSNVDYKSHYFLQYISNNNLSILLNNYKNNKINTFIGNCRIRMLSVQGMRIWYDNFTNQFDTFFMRNLNQNPPIANSVNQIPPIANQILPIANQIPPIVEPVQVQVQVQVPVQVPVQIPSMATTVFSNFMQNIINQQMNRIVQIDDALPIKPEFDIGSDKIATLQMVLSMKETFSETYNQAYTNYMNALEAYIKNQAKILVIQRLIALRRESTPEEFEN